MAASPWVMVLATLAGDLGDPPEKVVLADRYRPVEVDHRAHVARRIACRSCHGDGAITKVGHLGMTAGHERCRGCHRQERRGPVACGGCHAGAKDAVR